MSFSLQVKKELYERFPEVRHCCIAEILSVINWFGRYRSDALVIKTDNYLAAKKFYLLVKDTFRFDCDVSIKKSRQLKHIYTVVINDPENVRKVLNATGIIGAHSELNETVNLKKISPMVVSGKCCKRAYIRGAFISSGSMSDPEKSYHLEFVCDDDEYSQALSRMINSFGMKSKVTKRKDNYVVYMKESENIVDMLNIMEAHLSLLNLENIRVVKDMRNKVNRSVNCETANISKIIKASVNQIEDIKYIEKKVGLSYLSEQLEEVARIRLSHQQASLKEIGSMLSPSVSKSGVNHRLKKISEIADYLREANV